MDAIYRWIYLNDNVWISIKISLMFVAKVPINNIPALVQMMAWRRSGDKPLSEPVMDSLLTHICVTRPQWVNPQKHHWSPIECQFQLSLYILILVKFEGSIKIIAHLHFSRSHFSTLEIVHVIEIALWHDKASSMLHSQYHGCWWPGNSRSQGIYNHAPVSVPVCLI